MSTNKNNIKLIINKIKSVIDLKQELYEKLYDFLETILELNEQYNTDDNTKPNTNTTTTNIKHYFAPYIYTDSGNKINLEDCYRKTKCKNYMLAFLNGNNGIATWSNGKKYNENYLKDEINFIKENGGKIGISTGGAGGSELIKSLSVKECYNTIKYLIDNYQIDMFDFDIENGDIAKDEDIYKRIELIKLLKKDYPNLEIIFTLPIDPDGFRENGLKLINTTMLNTKIDCINLMTMDYGSYYAPNGKTDMAKYAIKCLEKVKSQLSQHNLKIGLTNMIGLNDVIDEIFTLENAKELLDYAKSHDNIYLLSFWCLNRDNGNKINYQYADSKYSGIEQNLFDFTKIFNNFN